MLIFCVCFGQNLNYILKAGVITLKSYCIRIRTRGGIYGQMYPSAWRSSQGRSPRELLKAEGYAWPYIPSWDLIRTLYHTQQIPVCNLSGGLPVCDQLKWAKKWTGHDDLSASPTVEPPEAIISWERCSSADLTPAVTERCADYRR